MSLFTGKTLMITGGTGSFGNAVLHRFLSTDIGENENAPMLHRNREKRLGCRKNTVKSAFRMFFQSSTSIILCRWRSPCGNPEAERKPRF